MVLEVTRDGRLGPSIRIQMAPAAPGLFAVDGNPLAVHLDGRTVDATNPASPGEYLVLFGTGLGSTTSRLNHYAQIPDQPASLERPGDLHVALAGRELDPKAVLYAGLTPGFAGLYQINLRLPDELPTNPEITLTSGDHISPAGLRLATQPASQ
jgi:uncharacterized protein (TIGR03437 family)